MKKLLLLLCIITFTTSLTSCKYLVRGASKTVEKSANAENQTENTKDTEENK